MTESPVCEQVRMAAMARLDNEESDLSWTEIEMHVRGCEGCSSAIAELTSMHADLAKMKYEGVDADLWPAIETRLNAGITPSTSREKWTIVALTVVLVAWRVGQLLMDLPGPVLNSAVPIAMVVIALWRLTGDPFAIQPSRNELEQRGAL